MKTAWRASFSRAKRHLSPKADWFVVFANKQPDAWETLVGALIRSGFVVDGSWPIQTEMGNRTRSLSFCGIVVICLAGL